MSTINNLYDFAAYINAADTWPEDAAGIISKNGWTDQTGETFGICTDPRTGGVLEFNSDGVAVVR